MFNIFRKKAVVDLMHYEEGVVYFGCAEPLESGSRIKVVARMPEGEEFLATLAVGDFDPTEALYSGRLEGTQYSPDILRLLPPRRNRRRAPRVAVSVGIMSPQVPGYRALTADLSDTGACLIVDGPLAPTTDLILELDLDAPGTSRLQVNSQVRWCVENQKTGKYLLGAQFLTLTTPQRTMLERYVHHVEDQQPT